MRSLSAPLLLDLLVQSRESPELLSQVRLGTGVALPDGPVRARILELLDGLSEFRIGIPAEDRARAGTLRRIAVELGRAHGESAEADEPVDAWMNTFDSDLAGVARKASRLARSYRKRWAEGFWDEDLQEALGRCREGKPDLDLDSLSRRWSVEADRLREGGEVDAAEKVEARLEHLVRSREVGMRERALERTLRLADGGVPMDVAARRIRKDAALRATARNRAEAEHYAILSALPILAPGPMVRHSPALKP